MRPSPSRGVVEGEEGGGEAGEAGSEGGGWGGVVAGEEAAQASDPIPGAGTWLPPGPGPGPWLKLGWRNLARATPPPLGRSWSRSWSGLG